VFFLLGLVAVVAASVPLLGGDLRRVSRLQLRLAWLLAAGAVAQLAVLGPLAARLPHGAAAALHVASYLPAAVVVVANRRMAGMALIGVGGLANLVAITANRGVMPASAWATRAAGRTIEAAGTFRNSTPLAHARLAWLGDVLVWPAPLPGATAFSFGDVLLVVGLAIALHRCCGSRLAGRARDEVAERPEPAGR
jgi:hypothetical protein